MPLKDFDPEQCFPKMVEELYEYVHARDDGLCLKCGNPGGPPHHVIYKSQGGKNKANNLATLCAKCHDEIHNKKDTVRELLLQKIKESESRFKQRLV